MSERLNLGKGAAWTTRRFDQDFERLCRRTVQTRCFDGIPLSGVVECPAEEWIEAQGLIAKAAS